VAATLQMLLIRVALILPLRAVTPAAVLFWSYDWFIKPYLHDRHPGPGPGRVGSILRKLLRQWLFTELAFYLFYRFKLNSLNNQKVRPPQLPSGKPLEVLRRCLSAVYDIQNGGAIGRMRASSLTKSPCLTPSSSAHNLVALMAANDETPQANVEGLLRLWGEAGPDNENDADSEATPAPSPESLSRSSSGFQWEKIDQVQLLALKWAEVTGWFLGSKPGEIRRGNVEEWVAWAFFNAAGKTELAPGRQSELDTIVSEVEQWAELRLPEGYNPNVRSMRLTIDPIPSKHRPLLYYIVTGWVMPSIQEVLLSRLGFTRYKSGMITYWRYPGASGFDPSPDSPKGIRPPPMVFCHGIGISILPYMHLLEDLLRWRENAASREVFLVSMPNISMRITDDAPSMAETVACISDMLDSWDVPKAHFLCHSFGSVVVSWMIKRAPHRVLAAAFLDPVSFVLAKPDVAYNFMYRSPDSPTKLLLNYFVSTELYISHSIARNFFWMQCILWPEDMPPGVPLLVSLSGKDSIVPAHSVRRYLAAYCQKNKNSGVEVMYFPDLGHGEINFGPRGAEATGQILDRIFDIEEDLTGWPNAE